MIVDQVPYAEKKRAVKRTLTKARKVRNCLYEKLNSSEGEKKKRSISRLKTDM